ncbi:MAG: ABC transporter permease [Desulfobacterales bacterium]|nr:ABC transporter permease [Desulfobacterales bacterium]
MGAHDIDILSLALLLVFLIPVLWLGGRFKLSLNRTILWSILRMTIQLSLVGLYLKILFKFNLAWVNVLYILVMVAVAAYSVLKSSRLRLSKLFGPVFISILLPVGTVLLFINTFVVRIENVFAAKYLIPICGMLLGNSMRNNIIGLSNFYAGLKENEKIYLYSIALGGRRMQALEPYFQESVIAAINPILASMATIGIVSLPGMMTGQILGGSIPMVAIKYQIVIMLGIFYTQFFSVCLTLLFSIRLGFDEFDVLRKELLC